MSELNTLIPLEMIDGSTVDITFTWAALKQLSVKRPEIYKSYVAVQRKGDKATDFDTVDLAYVGYMCALIATHNDDHAMTYDEFLERLHPNRQKLGRAIKRAFNPK